MHSEIVLIGPMGTGKSTLGQLLAEKLKLPQVSLDKLRWQYYRDNGFDVEFARQINEYQGFSGVSHYWKQFDAYAVERMLAEHCNCVFDFGAGHSYYEDALLLGYVKQVLARYSNVIMILPSPDLDESIEILRKRNTCLSEDGHQTNAHFVKHPSTHQLAKKTVYTKDKTPPETCDEILKLIELYPL